ncbi:hypothetical protein BKA70DRAFT_1267524 [Coprinopsis sp. MPI-PUGE-AT-0042]|nr:hypothetical protein BKA70DRAFT_1267524 [Coprinopsis sp. MPI-PUGE-AT-0042]
MATVAFTIYSHYDPKDREKARARDCPQSGLPSGLLTRVSRCFNGVDGRRRDIGSLCSSARPSEPTLPEALRLQPRPQSQPSFGKGKVEIKLEEYGDDISEVKHVDIEAQVLDEDTESGHGGRALLAPIATVLKADRMGIGLKPKTIAGPSGAYRIPQKRVTHNAAAMAAHIRAGEELRRQKRDHGRGQPKEATERKEMLAYLNS